MRENDELDKSSFREEDYIIIQIDKDLESYSKEQSSDVAKRDLKGLMAPIVYKMGQNVGPDVRIEDIKKFLKDNKDNQLFNESDIGKKLKGHVAEYEAQLVVNKIKEDIRQYQGQLEKKASTNFLGLPKENTLKNEEFKKLNSTKHVEEISQLKETRAQKYHFYNYLNDILDNQPYTLKGTYRTQLTAVEKVERIQANINSEANKALLKKDSDGDFLGFFHSVGRRIKAAAFAVVGKEFDARSEAEKTVEKIAPSPRLGGK